MKDRSMEKKIASIIIQVTSLMVLAAMLSFTKDIYINILLIPFAACWWYFGYLYKLHEKTKYTFRVWLKIRKLNKQIKKLKKVAETNLKGKGRDKKFCNPVYTAREVVDVKEKELKELVK